MMTDDQIKSLYEVTRICKGPYVLTDAEIKDYRARWDSVVHSDWDAAEDLVEELEDMLDAEHQPVEEGDWEELFRRFSLLWVSRQGCGYDVNSLVMQIPHNGTVHEIPCPQCGRTITMSHKA